ncbi:MAG TPA: Rrf2 family transcriptional regulator [Candidatus Avacidaminococcus intestinavium]|uniref:Rrf2 family transcriptional regulator n=1 Tax=Candidatus Avacidaminococcus intestinavium TaxID=2840684 RepID=A0A9D1SLE2_9FIRM|nr:Rrf2 family transcriptional regulator [Candidatus Avacidaminococcus intestinavium]
MKLSTKGRYGVIAMYDLAVNAQDDIPVSIKNIAERQQISEHYLEQLMGQLRKAGLVKSTRGAQGGYYLTREPAKITVGDIIRVMEGPIAPVDCLLSKEINDSHYCEKSDECVTKGIWAKVADNINAVLDEITLEDLRQSDN